MGYSAMRSISLKPFAPAASLLEPFRWKVRFDKLLDPFRSSQAQPQGAAFLFHMQVDVEKRAAQTFSPHPYRQQLIDRRVSGKLELKPVGQLIRASLQREQSRAN